MAQSASTQNKRGIIIPQPGFKQIYCRLCLSTSYVQYKQIFSQFDTTQSIAEVVQDFAKVSIFQEDPHSKFICVTCFNKLTETQNFKSLIEISDCKLRHDFITSEKLLVSSNNDAKEEKFNVEELDLKKEVLDCDDFSDNESNLLHVPEFLKTELLEDEADTLEIKVEDLKPNKIKKRSNKKKLDCNSEQIRVRKKRIKKDYRLECPHCDKVFKRHEERQRHLSTHTGVYAYYCSFCNKGLTGKSALKAHEAIHTGERNYQCETCGKSFKQASSLIIHKKTHLKEKQFKCDQCYKEYKSKQFLLLHIAAAHTSNSEKSNFICEICSKTYPTRLHLKIHMRTHRQREFVTCDICGKSVTNYTNHKKLHTKPYKCGVCSQGFSSVQILKEHSVVHTGERLFECDICKKTFGFSSALYTHKKIHDLTKRLKCEFCAKLFTYKHHWKAHLQKVHQQEK